jgi:hypothetical protein
MSIQKIPSMAIQSKQPSQQLEFGGRGRDKNSQNTPLPCGAVALSPEVSSRATPRRISASSATAGSAHMSKARWKVTCKSWVRGATD